MLYQLNTKIPYRPKGMKIDQLHNQMCCSPNWPTTMFTEFFFCPIHMHYLIPQCLSESRIERNRYPLKFHYLVFFFIHETWMQYSQSLISVLVSVFSNCICVSFIFTWLKSRGRVHCSNLIIFILCFSHFIAGRNWIKTW